MLNNFLAGLLELPVPPATCRPCRHAARYVGRPSGPPRTRRGPRRSARWPPSWSVTSVTAEAHHIARMVRSAEPAADDPTQVVRKDTPAHRADAGQAWGSLIHGLLEHAMRHPGATREDLRRLAMWLTVEEPQLRSVLDKALDTVAAAAAPTSGTRRRRGSTRRKCPSPSSIRRGS